MSKRFLIAAFLCALMLVRVGFEFFEPKPGNLHFVAKGEVAYGYGTSRTESLSYMKGFLNEHPEVKHLVLRRMPGTEDADTNLRIARLIRRRGLSTHLEKNSFIASGAVDLFLAGTERTMECGAQIGVHAWSSGHLNPRKMHSDPRQRLHERFLSDMGVSSDFYEFTRAAADPEMLHVLSPDEVERFELLTTPANCA